MSDRLRRILFAVIFVAAVLAIAYLLYYVFFRRPPEEVVPVEEVPVEVGLPNVNELIEEVEVEVPTEEVEVEVGIPGVDRVASGSFTETDVLTPEIEAQDPAIGADGDMRYYDPADDKFYKVDPAGNIVQLGSAQFPEVEQVTWADTSNETILEFPDGSNVYYDLDSNRQVTLPQEYEEFDFSPNSDQIAFKYMHIDEERRVLAISSPDGSSARTLESLGQNGDRVHVDWSPTGKVAATWGEFVDSTRQELGFIGLNNENFKGTVVEGMGIKSQYTDDGKQLLYSVFSPNTDYQSELWIVDADGDDIGKNRRDLNIRTDAEKCTISSDSETAYCGVPSSNIYGSGLEPGILDDVTDDIYKINLNTGTKTKLAVPVDQDGVPIYRVDQMSVTDDESKLIFQDGNSGQLVKLDLL